MRQLPAQHKEDRRTSFPRRYPRQPSTLSFYLRDSAADAALHLRYPLLGFSRATSISSPRPAFRTPESFTPSAGLRHFPRNFICRYAICATTLPCPGRIVNTIRHFLSARERLRLFHSGQAAGGTAFPPLSSYRPTMMSRISSSVRRMPSRARRPTLPMVFSTPLRMMPSPSTNW